MYGGFIAHLKIPVKESRPICERGYQVGIEIGDLVYAAYNIVNRLKGSMFSGMNLQEFLEQSRDGLNAIKSLYNEPMYELVMVINQCALDLVREAGDSETRADLYIREREFRHKYSHIGVLVAHVDFYQLKSFYFLEEHDRFLESLRRIRMSTLNYVIEGKELRFFICMTFLSLYSEEYLDETSAYRQTIDQYHAEIKSLANVSPVNFGTHDRLITAERLRVEGHELEAIDLFDEAMQLARENGMTHMEALAHELVGRMWLKRDRTTVAALHLAAAYDLYATWGATSKLQQMVKRFGTILSNLEKGYPESKPDRTLSLHDELEPDGAVRGETIENVDLLDFNTVIKASQAISQEIELENLLQKMMKIIIENAGADRGLLILERNGDLQIDAVATLKEEDVDVLQSVPIQNCMELSRDIARYVFRTGESVVLQDAANDSAYANDFYIRRNQVKSVLCAPVVHQDRKLGVLYLENSLTANAFTENRLVVLNILIAQAAISLENARLFELQRKTERAILSAQKLESLGVLAGGIAHDFNNILMSILGNADLALYDLTPSSPLRERLNEIVKASRHAAELCGQMLAYSGKGRFVTQALKMSEIVGNMTSMLRVTVSKSVELRFELDENLPFFEGDAVQIRQIIMNLIMNGAEAAGEDGGTVVVRTGVRPYDRSFLSQCTVGRDIDQGTFVYFEVADDGCGIDEETKSKLFDPFFTTKFTGRGLGLSAVLGIVRGHKGAIRVARNAGKGTVFTVCFPVVDEPPEELSRDEGVLLQRAASGGKVLLIDDEAAVLGIGRAMLERAGYDVIVAEDGLSGIESFAQHADEILCVILDLTMPHMNGEECFQELRRICRDVPVIIASGFNEHEVAEKFTGKDVDGFLQKPYGFDALADKIADVRRRLSP